MIQIQDYWDKEEQIKKAEEEARLNAISKTEVIKVVREEAKKLDIHPKEAIFTKASELFKKAQDAEHEVLKRQHTKKVKNILSSEYTKQASSQTSRRKRKHIELEPETRNPRLECNRTLPENVLFVNNMVIEEPEYEIFFTDEFAASMVKSPENARFSMKLGKLITEHLDQEKIKSKKVKLEALGYNMD
nr:hypothetical protein [Tanacetum cinerariifolium]